MNFHPEPEAALQVSSSEAAIQSVFSVLVDRWKMSFAYSLLMLSPPFSTELWILLKPRRVKGLATGEIEILFWEPVSGGNIEL